MNILLTLFEIQDYGGIVGDIEYLAKGLREHGHEVNLVMLRPSDRDPYIRKEVGPNGSYRSEVGSTVHTLAGWYGIQVMGYLGQRRIDAWKRFANEYDLVIHEIPNPKNDPEVDPEQWWKEIYEIDPPQLIAAHDAHFRDMYPYIREIAHKVRGISCTNHAGYNALSWFPGPRAFIGAAHEPLDWERIPPWNEKYKQGVCAHVWKAWKHMDVVVASAPYLKECALILGGDGIEGRYMRSKDKCKPKYKGLWDAFQDTEHQYRGLMTHGELFAAYRDSRIMVDMSWSNKFARLGNHFNRSIIEAYNNGCVPICTDVNMAPTNEQLVLFHANKNFVQVPHDIEPSNLAEVMDWAVNLPESVVDCIITEGRNILLDHFHYHKVCLEYLKLAEGKPAGIYPVLEVGEWPANMS